MAIVGESGVGKTTLINLLLGLYFPQKGKIFVDGKDIRKIDLKSYRSRVGVVSQEPTLFNDTIGRNISYGSFGKSGKEIVRAVNRAHADEFIDKFPKKYKQLVGWKGIKLSIGQKQRIALARAFLKDPDILILDEPTSALDAKSEQLIKESLEELMKGRTTFIIAHRLSTIREADKSGLSSENVLRIQACVSVVEYCPPLLQMPFVPLKAGSPITRPTSYNSVAFCQAESSNPRAVFQSPIGPAAVTFQLELVCRIGTASAVPDCASMSPKPTPITDNVRNMFFICLTPSASWLLRLIKTGTCSKPEFRIHEKHKFMLMSM